MSPQGDTSERGSDERPRRQHVLFVVEDDVSTLDLLCEVAQDAGWAAFGFTRLEEVRATLEHRRPTMLILDDNLPDGSGGDLARELREDPRTHDIPTLVCTAAHPMRVAEIGSWAPVIAKPFHLDDLERFLNAAGRRETRLDQSAAG